MVLSGLDNDDFTRHSATLNPFVESGAAHILLKNFDSISREKKDVTFLLSLQTQILILFIRDSLSQVR